MILGKTFTCTYKHFRLFAMQDAEGWQGAVYDLNASTFIYKAPWIHQTPEQAQDDARTWAEGVLHERLDKIAWSEST